MPALIARVAWLLLFAPFIQAALPVARADEIQPPWRAGPCALWTRVPPEIDYLAPLETDEGLWVGDVARGGFCGSGILMRRQADWTMSLTPTAPGFCDGFTALAEGTGWTAATEYFGSGSKILVRTSGEWEDISEVSAPEISFQTLRADFASGGGRDLFVATFDGGVFHYEVDGRAWRAITPPLTGPSRGLWGDIDGLYFLFQFGSSVQMSRLDGAGWTPIPPPEFAGFVDVAGLSPDEVYAISASRETLFRVDGQSPAETPPIPCGGTPTFQSLTAAQGQLVVELSCVGEHQLWKREADEWTLVATLPPAQPADTLRVSRNGQVYIGGGQGRVFRVLPTGLESLEQSPRPPASVLGGTSASSLFSGGDPGVAQLIDDQWQLLPGSPSSVRALWQAPAGALFAAAEEGDGISALWKYDGSEWSRLRSDAARGRARVVGRSESDFYWSMDTTVLHWDGADWTQLAEIPCEQGVVVEVTIAGTDVVLAHCNFQVFPPRQRLYEFNGTSWVYLTGVDDLRLFQGGPWESPITYLRERTTWRSRSQTGWTPLALPAGYSIQYFSSADGSTFVASDFSSYGITNGAQPWRVVSEWLNSWGVRDLWADDQFAASTRTFDPNGSPGQGIVLCDIR